MATIAQKLMSVSDALTELAGKLQSVVDYHTRGLVSVEVGAEPETGVEVPVVDKPCPETTDQDTTKGADQATDQDTAEDAEDTDEDTTDEGYTAEDDEDDLALAD